jgi:alcohol dehydrogenase class IV
LASIFYITQVQFDFGAVRLARAECERLGLRRPLICTDPGVVAAGLLQRLTEALGDLPFAVFDATPSNPTEGAVMAAVDAYRAHRADGLIALGGGSPIDLAKGVAILATHPGRLADCATILGGSPKISATVAPLIAIPTTAGTGSEVARGAIIILDDGRKLGFHSWHLVPRVALCDPELTLGLPPRLTAATGMDAIAHCIETYLSKAVNPPADAIALDGLQRGVAHIERAVRDGADRAARWAMMSASMQGAMAFQKGLGAVHSLSHALGALPVSPHHGTLNAVLLPEVVKFNEAAVPERVRRVAEAFGAQDGESLAGAIRALNARIGLPDGLAAMGIGRETYDGVVANALKDHCHGTNPREASADDYHRMLEASA